MADSVDSVQEPANNETSMVDYGNAVHACGLGSAEAEQIKEQNIHDATFGRRVALFDLVKAVYDRRHTSVDAHDMEQ